MIILVVAPHADDEVLGCGASIARHVAMGDRVIVAIMTNASIGAPEIFSSENVNTARREALRAHDFLGVHQTLFFDFPAPQLDQCPQYKISEALSSVIKEFRPETVYLPHRGDLHRDHGVIFNSALVACRPFADCSVQNIFCYETLSETEWGHPFGDDAFIPTHYVDVSNVFSKKLGALQCFESQLKQMPHPRSLSTIQALSVFRGSTISVQHAEAFMTMRTIARHESH